MTTTPPKRKLLLNVGVFILLGLVFLDLNWYKQSGKLFPSITTVIPGLKPTPSVSNFPTDGSKVGEARLYPDPKLTPGKVYQNVTKEDVCASGYSARTRNVPTSVKRQVYQEYNLPYPATQGEYEVDHFVPIEIGGSNDPTNLWPQPASPKPGFMEKDMVENYLHAQICNGSIDIKDAQRMIQTDWYRVYQSVPKGFKF